MSVSELLRNYYEEGKFNPKDYFIVLQEEFESISKLKEKYKKGDCNRKILEAEIKEKSKELWRLVYILKYVLLGSLEIEYDSSDIIKNYELVMKLILKKLGDEYILKRCYVNDFLPRDGEYIPKSFDINNLIPLELGKNDREDKLIASQTFVIGKEDALKDIDNDKFYYSTYFHELISKIVKSGSSIAMIADSHFHINNPTHLFDVYDLSKKVDVYEFRMSSKVFKGLIYYSGELYILAHNDELSTVARQLKRYIDIYGGDIDNLSIETLISRIAEIENSIGREPVLGRTKKTNGRNIK